MEYRLTGIVAAPLATGSSMAQMPSTSVAKTPVTLAPAGRSTKAPVVRTAKSLDCSKQADAKGLHGKPRKGFMSNCKKA